MSDKITNDILRMILENDFRRYETARNCLRFIDAYNQDISMRESPLPEGFRPSIYILRHGLKLTCQEGSKREEEKQNNIEKSINNVEERPLNKNNSTPIAEKILNQEITKNQED